MTILKRAVIGLAFWAGITGAGVGGATATELHVFSAGAVRAIVTELAQVFQQETGNSGRSPSAPSASHAVSWRAPSRWTWSS